MDCWGVCENFSFGEVRYECVMVARLKGICRANTVAWSIFFWLELLKLQSSYHLSQEEPLMAPVIANADTDSILFENNAMGG